MTRTLAGGTVPAAVMNIGKNFARCSAAASPARYPETVACELRASMPCARLMRGRRSKLKTVACFAASAAQRLLRLCGAEEAEQGCPEREIRHVRRVGGVHLNHQTGTVVHRGGIRRDGGARRREGRVAEAASLPAPAWMETSRVPAQLHITGNPERRVFHRRVSVARLTPNASTRGRPP